jgi:NADH:ubiquinone oxidoreductase subunit 4 (subunit M)
MGITLGGILTFCGLGGFGAFLIIIGHGLVSSGLFCVINFFYLFSSSRRIFLNKGTSTIPLIRIILFILIILNFSSPPRLSFISEFVIICGLLKFSSFNLLLLPWGVFLVAGFSIYLFSIVRHGRWFTLSYFSLRVNFSGLNLIFLHLFPVVSIIMVLPFFI